MLSMKSVAWALVLAASAVDMAVPLLVVPALVLGVSTAAHAAPAAETATRREVVSYRDLNLATPNGQAALQARLREAAEAACGPPAEARSLADVADYRACVAKAVQDARAALPPMREEASQPSHAG